jgi:hypothetical protein
MRPIECLTSSLFVLLVCTGAFAQVDPDRVLLLDINETNNSWTLAPRRAETSTKWSITWMAWLQDPLLSYGCFV